MPVEPPSSKTEHANNRDEPTDDASGNGAIAAAIQRLREDYSAAQKQNDAQHRENLTWYRRTTIGVGAYTILTVFLVLIAKYSLDTIRDTEFRQLRAYIGIVIPVDYAGNNALPPNIPTFHLGIKNAGQTPAYSVIRHSGTAIEPYPLPKNFGFFLTPPKGPDEPLSVFPGPLEGQGMELPLTRQLTPIEAVHIQDGDNWRLYIYGTINYDDAFGQRHYTNFCLGYYAKTPTEGIREACSQHNDSD